MYLCIDSSSCLRFASNRSRASTGRPASARDLRKDCRREEASRHVLSAIGCWTNLESAQAILPVRAGPLVVGGVGCAGSSDGRRSGGGRARGHHIPSQKCDRHSDERPSTCRLSDHVNWQREQRCTTLEARPPRRQISFDLTAVWQRAPRLPSTARLKGRAAKPSSSSTSTTRARTHANIPVGAPCDSSTSALHSDSRRLICSFCRPCVRL